jgi:O-antigen ligase
MEFVFISITFIAAIVIPLAFIFMVWGLFRITDQRGGVFFWSGLIGLLALIPVLSDLKIARGEYVDGILKDVWIPPGAVQFVGEWGSRGLIFLILGYGLVVIAKSLYSKQIEIRAGGWLFVAYLTLVTPTFISAIAGTRPYFIHFMFYEPLIFTLVYLARPSEDWLWYVKQFKRVLLIYISLSALFGVLAPTWSTGTALTLIPGFNFRLHGIFSHSNSLGMAALVYLVLDMADETRRTLYRKLAWLVSMGVLIATQSKTAWVGAVLAYLILLIYKLTVTKNSRVGHSTMPFIIAGASFLVGVGGLLLLLGSSVEEWLSGLDAQTYNSLTSLTGRTRIWEITINSWLDNPIFGYGPGLWDVEYRLQYAPQYLYIVGMAHNQFFQTLGESGALGVIGLSIYMVTLVKFGVQYFSVTRGVSLALVAVFLARSVSETPFRNLALDMMFFAHFILFVLLLSLSANASTKSTSLRQSV